MKIGDKVVCIKDFISERYSEESSTFHDEAFQFHRTMKKGDEFEIKKFHSMLDKWLESATASKHEVIVLTKGKTYEIKNILGESVRIKDDEGNSRLFSTLEDHISPISDYKFSDYFTTLVEARKKKLDDLSDENFNQFLKKLKKC